MIEQHTEIGGIRFALIPIIRFEDWLTKKYGSQNKFISLNKRDKEKIFLRWKWGFSNDRSNDELEISEKVLLRQIKDMDLSTVSEAVKTHFQHKIGFDRVCLETKKRIGLVDEYNPEVEKVKDSFDATEI